MNELMLHRGAIEVKRHELELVPLPEETESYQPVSHYHLADRLLTIGRDILTDVEMVRTGINKRLLAKWGGTVLCNIHPSGEENSPSVGKTRAESGIEEALGSRNNIGIVAIGNAPTALLKVIDLLGKDPPPQPLPLVIGVPVGFVKALESKALLSAQTFPFITNLSRKGGTPAAVAIVNALLTMAAEED